MALKNVEKARVLAIATIGKTKAIKLLARSTYIGRQRLRVAAPKRVNVQPAAPGVPGIHRQFDRLAARPHIHENPLYAVLMKLVVVAKAHQILQQTFLVDLRA